MKYNNLNDDVIVNEKDNNFLKFLYNNILGRTILKVITKPIISEKISILLNKKISILLAKKYIKKYNINLSDCEKEKFYSFNDFFTRKYKTIGRSSKETDFISTAESKITYYQISKELIINIKNSKYTIDELIKDIKLAREYEEGICLVYRLTPNDYHRYIFVDNGIQKKIKRIQGILHTVSPISYERYKVFSENTREVSLLRTENFDDIIQIEVGALCVGKIQNNNNYEMKKYKEKGYFEFGGSTIIQLIKKDILQVNDKIIKNSEEDIETKVKVGEIIAIKKHK